MIVDKKYFKLWKDSSFYLTFSLGGYFSPHPEIDISIFGYHFLFILPIFTKYCQCVVPIYGIKVIGEVFYVEYGLDRYWAWILPFVSMVHMKHCVDVRGRGYVDVDEYGEYSEYRGSADINKGEYDYTDIFDGAVVKATYWKEYRSWRRKWLTWLPCTEYRMEVVEVEFDKPVGANKQCGGGVVNCICSLLPGETALECVKRMEKELID